jgi:hypothetical protein
MRPNNREIIIVIGHNGLITALEILEYDIKYICNWKHKANLMTFDYLGPIIFTKFKNKLEGYFLDIDKETVNLRFFNKYDITMDVTDFQDICLWRTFGMMILVFPQMIQFPDKTYNALRMMKIGGVDAELDSDYLPNIGRITVCICQERSRFLLTTDYNGYLRRFHLRGEKEYRVYEVDEWKLNKPGVTFLQENYSKRSLYVGTDEGEVLIANYKHKRILQEVKYSFPIHWICERNFDVKKVQMLVTGPKTSEAQVLSVTNYAYKKGFEMPPKLRSEDNPYLKMTMLEGTEEDFDSELGREFIKKPKYKKRRIEDLPPKPPTLEELLE